DIGVVPTTPVLTASGGTTASFEQTPIAVDSAITLADADSATLSSAKVQITVNLHPSEDLLAFSNDGLTMGDIAAGAYNSATATLTAVDEDSNPAGQTVSAIFGGNFTDPKDAPPNTFAGIAITANAATATEGTWQYSTNGGANWTGIGSVSDSGALLLSPTTLLRFLPPT